MSTATISDYLGYLSYIGIRRDFNSFERGIIIIVISALSLILSCIKLAVRYRGIQSDDKSKGDYYDRRQRYQWKKQEYEKRKRGITP